MATALVYRPDLASVDRNGDTLDADGNVARQTSPGTYLGTLAVVIADPAVESLSRGVDTDTASGNAQARGAYASVDALIGAPMGAAIVLQHGDIIVTDDQGVSYSIFGPRTYGGPNPITGQPVRINGTTYYWVRATSVV
jgi:hypothetical protein